MSMQPSAARPSTQSAAAIDSLIGDIQYYLTLSPPQLPSRYFYDPLGSALFEAICELPWYRITKAERALLERHAGEIFARIGALATLVELGPGSGDKLAALVAGGGHAGHGLTVHLVDVSAAALDLAGRTLVALDADLRVVAHQATYENGLAAAITRRRTNGRALTLFLGSNIGNFDPPGADAFLRAVRRLLKPGDALLIGTDLVKPEADLLLAYDDPLGVTAAFNRNLLVRINRELGADFDIGAFRHHVVWNADQSRVEMHLVADRPQHVRIPAASMEVAFQQGEAIWTESSYKYRPEDVVEMLELAGFHHLAQWIDEENGFALTLVEANS
jgi:L-histidine N-alpha-methyltransferase